MEGMNVADRMAEKLKKSAKLKKTVQSIIESNNGNNRRKVKQNNTAIITTAQILGETLKKASPNDRTNKNKI
jgi:hypothetical protein